MLFQIIGNLFLDFFQRSSFLLIRLGLIDTKRLLHIKKPVRFNPVLVHIFFIGSIFGFIAGLFQDLFNPSFLGLNALTKTLVGFALGRAGAQTERDHPVFLLALFGVSALAHDFIYLLFFTQLRLGHFFVTWLTVSLPSAVYTAVVGVAVHVGVAFFLTEVVRNLGKTRS